MEATRSAGVIRALAGITAGLVVGLAIAAPGSAEGLSRTHKPKTFVVKAAGGPVPFTWAWAPAEITISAGDRVTWKNPTDATHHVTAWGEGWTTAAHVDIGGDFTYRFKKPGVYRYWCDIVGHADIVYLADEGSCVGMCGVIVVE